MSNAKWRKLFTALAEFPIYRLDWRFVDRDETLTTLFAPQVCDLLERGLRDGRLGPLEYRVIESISIPASVEATDRFGALARRHDLAAIEAAITRSSQLCLTHDNARLIIHGYT